MSRNYDLDDRPDRIELADQFDRPDHIERTGPADGCTGSPWCECWDCDRVPAGGFFAFENDRRHDVHEEDRS